MRGNVKVAAIGVAATIVLAGGSTVAVAAASGGFTSGPSPVCSAPALSGAVIDVALADMGGHMGQGRPGGMMAARGMAGMMVVRVSPTSASAGAVSLQVTNLGAMTHELVVLPLYGDARPGQRAVGADGKVDETASLGEASNSCGSDEGDGILPGAQGWTTRQLTPGRYELICNLPGHYAAGMYAELDVTSIR